MGHEKTRQIFRVEANAASTLRFFHLHFEEHLGFGGTAASNRSAAEGREQFFRHCTPENSIKIPSEKENYPVTVDSLVAERPPEEVAQLSR